MIVTKEHAAALCKLFGEKAQFYNKKAERARKYENRIKHREIYKKYNDLSWRAYNLHHRMTYETKITLGRWGSYFSKLEYDSKLSWKAKKKTEFETKRKYSPYFLSLSFGADYGTWKCDLCKTTFHHSPSRITQGLKTIHECVCGHCTNYIIYQDHNCQPYN